MLYKYVGVRNCKHWLQSRTIAFAALETLNDPYESLILSDDSGCVDLSHNPFTTVRGVMPLKLMPDSVMPMTLADSNRTLERESAIKAELHRTHRALRDRIRDLGILSLTTRCCNMVMWAHYADNSRGLCVGVDLETREGFKANPADIGTRIQVTYDAAPNRTRSSAWEPFVRESLGRKQSDWRYEREVRFVRELDTFDLHADASCRIGLLRLHPEWVREIIVGVNPHPEVMSLLQDFRTDFSTAKIGQIVIGSNGYESSVRWLDHLREVSILKQSPSASPTV